MNDFPDDVQKKIDYILEANGHKEYVGKLHSCSSGDEMFRLNLEWLGYEGDTKEIRNALVSGMDIDRMIELGSVRELK
jgi:hypothetical protein